MYYYCTLFNANYLTRGIAMIESLQTHSKNFHLYILAFDTQTEEILKSLQYKQVSIIKLTEFEDKELLSIKNSRTLGEYCWTCTPSLIDYCIRTFSLPSCTYIDADLYFYEDPNSLIDEMQDNSILLTQHNYTPKYNQESTSGIYCVQFMCFKNNEHGLKALQWWREKCLEWCFARHEYGKFGDQKYLDDWLERFNGVYVPSDPRYALAPWNIQQYARLKPIFYHFHNLIFIGENKVDLGPYTLPKEAISRFYAPYIAHLLKLRIAYAPHNFDLRQPNQYTLKSPIIWLKRHLKGNYNIYPISAFYPSNPSKNKEHNGTHN